MIYVTGDTHRQISRFMPGKTDFIHDMTWSKDDILIVCGDFGFVFLDNAEEHDWLDWLERTKPYTIAFVDGNHENHKRLAEYPEKIWNGGKIHRVRANIIHLQRGQVFTIEGKKIFTMGGAYSIDRARRKLNYSYWEEELMSNFDREEAVMNLKKCNYKIDYAITHTGPREVLNKMGFVLDPHDELPGFLEYVMYQCKDSLKCWYFGHWHIDEEIYGGRFRALFNDVVKID